MSSSRRWVTALPCALLWAAASPLVRAQLPAPPAAQPAAARVVVETYYEDPHSPAGAGVQILVDGAVLGSTGPDGRLAVELVAGRTVHLRARAIGLAGGALDYTVAPLPSGEQAAQILMQGEGLPEEIPLRVDDLVGGVLDARADALQLRFAAAAAAPAPLTQFGPVELYPKGDPDSRVQLSELFELLPDGRLQLRDPAVWRSALLALPAGPVSIEVYAEDGAGLVYSDSTSFLVGCLTLSGALRAPPSQPQLAVGGLEVTATYLNDSTLQRSALAAADGSFSFAALPAGNWEIRAHTESGGMHYYGDALFAAAGDVFTSIPLLHVQDLRAGVSPFSVTPSAPSTPRTTPR